MVDLKRKLYKRGSSHEVTIPMPLLFSIDKTKKNEVVFRFDQIKRKLYVEFEEKRESD